MRKLLAEGYSYRIIAARCDISYAPVNTHVSHICEKLQVKGVASAVDLAARDGVFGADRCRSEGDRSNG